MGIFSLTQELAIDLGTANTLIIYNGKVVVDEPSIVALDVHTGKLVAIGHQARQMHEKTNPNIKTIRPLKDGVIADFNATELMLRGMIKKVKTSGGLFAPSLRMVICIPSGSTNVEIRAVRDSAEHAGGREVYMIYEPMAAALGAGLDVEAPEGNMVIDIGGGSLEVAMGSDEDPTVALSVPAGAGRVTREFLPESGVADDDDLEAARKNIRKILEPMVKSFPKSKHPMHAVGTSKTIRSLARLAGAVMRQPGRVDTSIMTIDQLEDWLPRLAAIAPDQRTALPGVTPERTYQIVGGGLVIDEIMKALDVKEIEICPWALREGAILRWLDQFGRTRLGF